MILVFLGAPGSGKGTQAKRLYDKKKLPQLSTGDMFRAAIKAGTPLGVKAKTFMDKGELVPDAVTVGLVEERIQQSDCKNGFILDGFPRTIPQAEALEKMLEGKSKKVNCAILFEVPDSELVARLSGRRTCPKCGAVFHVQAAPPKKDNLCDKCGSALIQRDDDKIEVISKRLQVYNQQTAPLVGFYQSRDVLKSIDASAHPDQVEKSLNRAID